MYKQPHKPPIFTFRSLLWVIVFVLSFCIALLIGYWLGFSQAEKQLEFERTQSRNLAEQIRLIAEVDDTDIQSSQRKQDYEVIKLKKELEKIIEKERSKGDKAYVVTPPSSVVKNGNISEIHNAKLVIIIDDVSYAHDVKSLQSIGIPLMMSFLPPSNRHPESAKLAQGYKNTMVHLPLEAVDFSDEEAVTLRVTDTEETIAKRISTLKQLYPSVRYMNNHTGSKFTADTEAMERLLRVMKKEGLIFVDSRTTGKTKVPEVSRKLGVRYVGRDVFLDHKDGVNNVKKQIQEAVAVAKRHGSAIAIGHPRPDTIKALRESKALLGEVQLVGIEQI